MRDQIHPHGTNPSHKMTDACQQPLPLRWGRWVGVSVRFSPSSAPPAAGRRDCLPDGRDIAAPGSGPGQAPEGGATGVHSVQLIARATQNDGHRPTAPLPRWERPGGGVGTGFHPPPPPLPRRGGEIVCRMAEDGWQGYRRRGRRRHRAETVTSPLTPRRCVFS